MKIRLVLFVIVISLVVSFVSPGIWAGEEKLPDKAGYLSDIISLMEMKWPENRTINIVCHGHSVPAGYFKTPVVDTFNAYPHLLHRELKSRFPYAVINVIVTAIGGETSEQGAARFERRVLSHDPDVLTIDYALNDMYYISLEKARESWSFMIESAKAKGIKILLLTPTVDLRSDINDPDDILNRHAEQIRELAREYHVGLVDSLAAFKTYRENEGNLKDLMSQQNHPNRKGHDLVVKELIKWFPESM